jgi:hypothetical protein
MRWLLLALCATPALAADHAEAPGAGADPAADLADYFAWAKADRFVAIVTFAPFTPAGGAATWDADVLYTVHVDRDGDNDPDVSILVRFGQAADGSWGVQAMDVPGQDMPMEGAVEAAIDAGGAKLWAGLRDDPFFFDAAGFGDTLATGTIAFDSTRDGVAGANVTAIVLDLPLAAVAGGSTTLNTWATTARK